MTDFKIADGTADVIEYGPWTKATTTGLTFVTVPADADLAEVKAWGPGGGGGGRGESGLAKAGDGGGGGFIHARNIPVVPGEDLVLVVGVGGAGGAGLTGAGESGDGGAGGGRSHAAKFPSIVTLCGAGAGGGGGGVGSGAPVSSEFGGAGGPGGGDVGGDGTAASGPWGSPATEGLGGTLTAGGGGGNFGGGDGDDGASITGGNGGNLVGGAPDGLNASGGTPGGGDGGAYDGIGGGGGGGGSGHFGGGGGAAGDFSGVSEPGTGGGGGSGFVATGSLLLAAAQGVGINGAGQTDVDYPGAFVGSGGLGGLVADDGVAGQGGAVFIRFATLVVTPTTNDIVIENDAPVMVEGVDQIAQQVRTILLTCQGEWFLDLAAGTPWFQRIIGHKFNAGQMNITVRDAILSVDGVASIRDLTSVRGSEARSASVTVTVLTAQGAEVIIEAEVP